MSKPRRFGACFEHGAPGVLPKPRRFGVCLEHGAPDVLSKPRRFGFCFEHGAPDVLPKPHRFGFCFEHWNAAPDVLSKPRSIRPARSELALPFPFGGVCSHFGIANRCPLIGPDPQQHAEEQGGGDAQGEAGDQAEEHGGGEAEGEGEEQAEEQGMLASSAPAPPPTLPSQAEGARGGLP